MHRNALLAALVAAAFTAVTGAQAAKPLAEKKPRAPQEVAVDVPPPSGTWEAKAPAAEGYVWSAGYYEWKDTRYAWKGGEWVLVKPGLEYRQRQWTQRADGKWVLKGGDWVQPDKLAGKL